MPDGSRYDEDFFLWTRDQAERLRAVGSARSNLDLDWANLAEEIESVGNSDRRELRSRLTVILEHLLKLKYSSAERPRVGWRETIRRERHTVELVLNDSPSLQPQVATFTTAMFDEAAARVTASLAQHDETRPVGLTDRSINMDLVDNVLSAEFFPEQVS